jgi:hypothetical protein
MSDVENADPSRQQRLNQIIANRNDNANTQRLPDELFTGGVS